MAAQRYEELYGVRLLDDLHNYFPAILYDHTRFNTVPQLLGYMQGQIADHFNLFSRGARAYQRERLHFGSARPAATTAPATTMRNMPTVTTTETIDITPLFTRRMGGTAAAVAAADAQMDLTALTGLTGGPLDLLFNALQGVGGAAMAAAPMTDVVVAPTIEQVEAATNLRVANEEEHNQTCAICQDNYTNGQIIRTVQHCEHEFHRTCIDQWFEQHVQCPVCRFDIRQSQNTEEQSS